MTTPAFEAMLARLYTDEELRRQFLEDPERVARQAGLTGPEREYLLAIDRFGLEIAAKTFIWKRLSKKCAKE